MKKKDVKEIIVGLFIAIICSAVISCATVKEVVEETKEEISKEVKKEIKAIVKDVTKVIKVRAKEKVKTFVAKEKKKLEEKLGFSIYRVKKDDCLSVIAYDVYRNQFMWPDLFMNNQHACINEEGVRDADFLRIGTLLYVKLNPTAAQITRSESIAGFGD